MSAGHVAPKSLYYTIFLALMVGTGLTVGAAFVDMGAFNNVVMLAIACTKALLVVLFFMHVRWSSRLTWVVVASGFFWLLILFGVTMWCECESDMRASGSVAGAHVRAEQVQQREQEDPDDVDEVPVEA